MFRANEADYDHYVWNIAAHCFHYSTSEINWPVTATATHSGNIHMHEAVYLHHKTLASYVHWYWPSNSALIGDLFLGRLT